MIRRARRTWLAGHRCLPGLLWTFTYNLHEEITNKQRFTFGEVPPSSRINLHKNKKIEYANLFADDFSFLMRDCANCPNGLNNTMDEYNFWCYFANMFWLRVFFPCPHMPWQNSSDVLRLITLHCRRGKNWDVLDVCTQDTTEPWIDEDGCAKILPKMGLYSRFGMKTPQKRGLLRMTALTTLQNEQKKKNPTRLQDRELVP